MRGTCKARLPHQLHVCLLICGFCVNFCVCVFSVSLRCSYVKARRHVFSCLIKRGGSIRPFTTEANFSNFFAVSATCASLSWVCMGGIGETAVDCSAHGSSCHRGKLSAASPKSNMCFLLNVFVSATCDTCLCVHKESNSSSWSNPNIAHPVAFLPLVDKTESTLSLPSHSIMPPLLY